MLLRHLTTCHGTYGFILAEFLQNKFISSLQFNTNVIAISFFYNIVNTLTVGFQCCIFSKQMSTAFLPSLKPVAMAICISLQTLQYKVAQEVFTASAQGSIECSKSAVPGFTSTPGLVSSTSFLVFTLLFYCYCI